ncbi:hypothetical protein B0T17DRAFT_292232 [Bombardia bombarda]|uniref:Uncharacterized protein n=1 Tax=Bombardia bombarda TaxID=252184 RepID=A0AA40C139_9PEZI|nr:hypothetical protein B0T17DRAFT_292232 [Bombardia bombarda]
MGMSAVIKLSGCAGGFISGSSLHYWCYLVSSFLLGSLTASEQGVVTGRPIGCFWLPTQVHGLAISGKRVVMGWTKGVFYPFTGSNKHRNAGGLLLGSFGVMLSLIDGRDILFFISSGSSCLLMEYCGGL